MAIGVNPGQPTVLYKGMKLHQDQIEEYKSFIDEEINLYGFTTVTRNK